MTERPVEKILGAIRDRGSRQLVAIAGPPASGKSTLSEALVSACENAALVPMDGFHLDNAILDQRGLRDRKGAPETFDVDGFRVLIERLKAGAEVVVPRFDRAQDQAIAGAAVVPSSVKTVFVEGNYLMFDEPRWRDFAPLWDLSVFLPVEEMVLEQRLVQRWLDHGLSPEHARARALGNDIPNARRIMRSRLEADLMI